MKISVVGLGKLGAPLAAVMAHKGHTVVGVDVNLDYVAAVNEGRAPVDETGLQALIDGCAGRLSATCCYEQAVLGSEATFLIVPTPSEKDGRFSLDQVLSAAEKIGAALRKKDDWHLVVLSSTVMPGSTGGELLPALERSSGKICGRDFGLCYNPEFIALGSVIRDMLNPDLVLIGESDPGSGRMLEELYWGVCQSRPQIKRMNFVNAELAKLSVNTFVTTKISYANMLAQVCETLPGADVDVVTSAIACDSRIGGKYLKGALGFGGPCFPRDNAAFSVIGRENGVPALLSEATDVLNRRQIPRLAEMVMRRLPQGGVAGVLGLSYKAETAVIERSQGLELARCLADRGANPIVYDPAAMENARRELGDRVSYAASAAECARNTDVLAITTPWPEFALLAPDEFRRNGPKAVVIDCWRILPEAQFEGWVEYLTLGRGGGRSRTAEAD